MRVVGVWHDDNCRLSDDEIQCCHDNLARYGALTAGVELLEVPKRHLSLHLINDLIEFGNPKFYNTFKDEADNKTLKGCCRLVSQLTFEPSVLSSMQELSAQDCPRRRCARMES